MGTGVPVSTATLWLYPGCPGQPPRAHRSVPSGLSSAERAALGEAARSGAAILRSCGDAAREPDGWAIVAPGRPLDIISPLPSHHRKDRT